LEGHSIIITQVIVYIQCENRSLTHTDLKNVLIGQGQ
jgi:hypothetical protein